MSIAELATGDTVVEQTVTSTVGAIFGSTPSVADGPTHVCNVQSMSVGESKKFSALGQVKLFNVFFATDPTLERNSRLKWTKTDGNQTTFAVPRILKVLATDEERNPEGSEVLYIAQCVWETTEGLT